MNRADFLEMCKAVAVLPGGIGGVKQTPPELHLKYNGMTFYPIGYKLSFTKYGNPAHTAILHDINANSIIECDLLKLERSEVE